MKLVTVCKERLQLMRDEDWDSMLSEVSSFCTKHRIKIPDMNDVFQREGRPRRNVEEIINPYHYRVEYLNTVVYMQLLELNNRFNETNIELLLSVACLGPIDSFSAFDKDKLILFARFYPRYFSPTQLVLLEDQLLNYIADVRYSNEFLDLKGIVDLAVKMVEEKKDIVYPLVYLLLTLALLLPVATATIERVFSAMKIVKNRLLNRMRDEWMNDILICYIERFIFDLIGDATIMNRFQKMRTRRGKT